MFYDLLVIGDDREGLDRAVTTARLGHRAAIVLNREQPPSAEILAKGAEQEVLRRRGVTMWGWRREIERLSDQLRSGQDSLLRAAGIDQFPGRARFIAPASVEIRAGQQNQLASAARFVIACGTVSRQPASFQIDGRRVVVAETLMKLDEIPRSALVVGAGMTGRTAALTLARLGVEVTVVDEHISLFDLFQIFDDSFDLFQSMQIAFRLGEEVIGTELIENRQPAVRTASGRILRADVIVVCVGREGNTRGLNLEAIDVGLDERGRVWCDSAGQTWSPHVVAVGDVVGFSGRSSQRSRLVSAS
ncbi:FAD-dependent oxidoreductase [Schlesneria sp.]|uniref:FAD-dependent oxidoreductase n=1 Tax=Schlesneria sp. TaxID=2762018 RepID=UPI002F160859